MTTILNEDGEEALDIALNEERKKSTHSLSYNVLNSGAVRVASFSNTNAVYEGVSGEIIAFRIMATDDVAFGTYFAELYNVVFTTPDAVDYRLPSVTVQIDYSSSQGGEIEQEGHDVEVHASPYGRCICDGYLIEPSDSNVVYGVVEDGYELKFYFVPFEGYMANSMKRNGEVIAIHNNIYEEIVTEDIAFTDVNYVTIADTLVVTETIVDTLVQTETVVDTLVLTETVVDTLVLTETVVDTLVLTETVVDTLVLTETVVDTLVLTETVVDTLVLTETVVDTMLVEKWDTVFVTEIEELPMPVITCDSGIVTITCEDPDAIILYAIDGDPIEGSVYVSPFRVTGTAKVSAVAIRTGDVAILTVAENSVAQSHLRVVSRRYYTTNGVEVTSPEDGVTIVVAEYEGGATQVYKLVKR
ncbi:MAG: chitobiase/beta-hexosaminidase C-terminal domain-containing protein [Bacteroidaceae bacterium]|nr:chitobiase/beta-hexosaminidase C-terminal domain-containing protein [Bacteroidaceae bacterium]